MTQRRFFAGVDGGGTKTVAVIVDEHGNEQGRASSGSGNYQSIGLERAANNIKGAVSEAAKAAGADIPLETAWIGLAGVDRPADKAILGPHLEVLAGNVLLGNDAELALSPLPDTVGVAAVAGTGAIAIGHNASGQTLRSGGWGHIIGDEGSGYDLGRLALQAILRSEDGRARSTTLRDRVIEHWNLEDFTGIIGKVYPEVDKAEVARLSSIVFAEARTGDPTATELVDYAAGEIALLVEAVAARLDLPKDGINVALTGGLLLHEERFRENVLERIRRKRGIRMVELVFDPALSAARAAIDLPTD